MPDTTAAVYKPATILGQMAGEYPELAGAALHLGMVVAEFLEDHVQELADEEWRFGDAVIEGPWGELSRALVGFREAAATRVVPVAA